MKKGLRCLFAAMAVICAAIAVWCGYSLYKTLREYERGEEDLKQVYEAVENINAQIKTENNESPEPELNNEQEDKEAKEKLEIYRKLKESNGDLVGWVRIDNTPIDYPVMQTPDDPDFYLTHGFEKNRSVYGMIYMDARCRLDGSCSNYLLYGHHMKNGSMFASLDKYGSEDYYKENPVIRFDTLDECGTWEIFAVFKISASGLVEEKAAMLTAGTEENYNALVEYAKAHSFYDTGITPEWPETLLTLATCEYTQKDGRLLVIARRAY